MKSTSISNIYHISWFYKHKIAQAPPKYGDYNRQQKTKC